MATLKERISNVWKKYEGKIALLGITTVLSGAIAISESQKIGSYRPEGLSRSYTSYTAYDKGNSVWLLPPVLKGFGHGPIIDEGKDGTIDYVGTITYPRMPVSFNQLEIGSPEQRQRKLEQNQVLYDDVMEEIRDSEKR